MKEIRVFEHWQWNPFTACGLTHPFFTSSFWNLNLDTITHTWAVLVVLLLLLAIARFFLARRNNLMRNATLLFIDAFRELAVQSFGRFIFSHYALVVGLFLFIFLCNSLAVLPHLEEPTADLNTTLALGIITFTYIHVFTIKTHGIRAYIKEYFAPFFLLFPLNVIGKIANVVSISFRLFGNIFGGAIISKIYAGFLGNSLVAHTMSLLLGINIGLTLFFGIFEGLIQAFVFSILALTYLATAIVVEEAEEPPATRKGITP